MSKKLKDVCGYVIDWMVTLLTIVENIDGRLVLTRWEITNWVDTYNLSAYEENPGGATQKRAEK